jgi:nucleoside diphosphate kinase
MNQSVEEVLTRLDKDGLKLKSAKCLGAQAVNYLGFYISPEGIPPN